MMAPVLHDLSRRTLSWGSSVLSFPHVSVGYVRVLRRSSPQPKGGWAELQLVTSCSQVYKICVLPNRCKARILLYQHSDI